MTSVPNLDTNVDYEDSKESIESILRVIKPEWNLETVQMADLSFGYVNKNVGCTQEGEHGGVFVRMINSKFDPKLVSNYKKISRFLNEHELCPRLVAEFENGICSELVQGESLSWETRLRLRDEELAKSVMRAVARYHTAEVFEAAKRAGIRDLDDANDERERMAKVEKIWIKFTTNPAVPQRVKDQLPTVEEMLSERKFMSELMKKQGAEKALVHMDVNPSNIIIRPDGEVTIVDYDLTGIGFVPSDIASFFHGFINLRDPVMTDYPDAEFRRTIIRYYLTVRQRLEGTEPVTDAMVEKLCADVDVSRLAWLFRFIFVGPFLGAMHSEDRKKVEQLMISSVMYYEEYKRLKAEYNL